MREIISSFHFTVLKYFRLLPTNTLREKVREYKKRGVTALILSVSAPLCEHKYLYNEKNEQHCRGVRLRTYDEEKYAECIQHQ